MKPVPETQEVLDELARHGESDAAGEVITMGQRAKEVVPECVGLSLAMVENGLTFTLVATRDELAVLDAVQYLDGGRCVAAVDHLDVLDVNRDDLFDENRWLMFARASAAAGVASSLSLPILRSGAVVGGVNLYASAPGAFRGRHEELAQALGASAEGAVTNADLSFTTRLKAAEAPTRMAQQEDVDVAVGIIAAGQDVDLATAKSRLENAAARAGITEVQAARAIRHLGAP